MKVRTVKAKLPKSVKRIVILKSQSGSTQEGTAERVVVKRKRSRKKQSKGLMRIWERLARRSALARATSAEDYRSRHGRSNRKRRDGWLRDYAYNTLRSSRKGAKELKLSKILG